jgi:hypothetical protein
MEAALVQRGDSSNGPQPTYGNSLAGGVQGVIRCIFGPEAIESTNGAAIPSRSRFILPFERTQKRQALLNHYLTFERRWSEQAMAGILLTIQPKCLFAPVPAIHVATMRTHALKVNWSIPTCEACGWLGPIASVTSPVAHASDGVLF